jgi:hypothetical protein
VAEGSVVEVEVVVAVVVASSSSNVLEVVMVMAWAGVWAAEGVVAGWREVAVVMVAVAVVVVGGMVMTMVRV